MKQAARSALLAVATLALCAGPASAQASRTFVSGGGNDANSASNCGRSVPCRSFGAAIGVTNTGGEIVVLDSAGYGPFTITKVITITAIGVEAAMTTTSGAGITISAGSADVVNLRGLTLTGGGAGANGILFNSGGTLNIQNCAVSRFTNDGLRLLPTIPSTINVSDTIVANNGGQGVNFGPHASASAFFERVQSIGNGNSGFLVADNNAPSGSTIKATAANSIASQNSNSGFELLSVSALQPAFMIMSSQSIANQFGITAHSFSGMSGTMIIANTKVYGNTNARFFESNATIKTFGNNYFANNGSNTGSLTPIMQQ